MSRPFKFTMIEMIAVITIIVLLMGLAVPAFESSATGPKVNQAATQIKLAMEQAALDAMTSGRFVAIIFPLPRNLSRSTTNWGESEDRLRDFYFTSYRLAFVKKDGNDYVFDEWAGVWRTIPNGTVILSWQPIIANNVETLAPMNAQAPGASAYLLTGLSEVKKIVAEHRDGVNDITFSTFSALVFAPYGGTNAPAFITVGQATVSRRNNGYIFTYQDRDGDKPSNYRSIWVNQFTGGVRYL